MKPSRLCFGGLVACVAALVGCDHATKLAAETSLRDHPPLQLVRGVVDLSYTENRGIAFDGFTRLSLHPSSWLLVAFGLATTLAVIAVWVRRRRAGWPEHVGFACVVAGAIGNVLDRAARGHVIDFIHVRFWPVFNVADVLVVTGVGVLLLAASRSRAAPPA
jgi:signal peptidase II